MTTDQTMPTVGARIRVTRTHESGDSLTFDVRVQSFDDAHGVPVVRYESGGVALTGADGWTVTWEEIEPAPVALPPIPEPGYYLALGHMFEIESDGTVSSPGWVEPTDWADGHQYGPFTRLVPATDVYVHYNAVSEVVTCEEIQQAMQAAAATMRDVARNGITPATDVVDAGIVRELTEALLLLITAATNGHMPLPSTLHQAREAFARARAEGATGGER